MAEPMLINTTAVSDGTAVVTIRGDVDINTAEQVREQFLLAFARHPGIILDLSQAMFFDISGLRALSALHREAVRQNRPAPTLRGVRPLLAKMLKANGLDKAFTVEPGLAPTRMRTATTIGAGRVQRGSSELWADQSTHRGSPRALAGAAV